MKQCKSAHIDESSGCQLSCTYVSGHEGDHVEHCYGQTIAAWPNESKSA